MRSSRTIVVGVGGQSFSAGGQEPRPPEPSLTHRPCRDSWVATGPQHGGLFGRTFAPPTDLGTMPWFSSRIANHRAHPAVRKVASDKNHQFRSIRLNLQTQGFYGKVPLRIEDLGALC